MKRASEKLELKMKCNKLVTPNSAKIINENEVKKNSVNNDFKNLNNEKQNSLASGIRIGFGSNFPILKQHFVRIKEVEYSTDFEFFLQNQVYVIVNKDKSCSIICLNVQSIAHTNTCAFA